MVFLAKLSLPEDEENPHKPSIVQLPAKICLKWLNPRRKSAGLPIYSDSTNHPKENVLPVPPIERLRYEIIEAVRNRTYDNK
jgi:hypothetical protein